MKQLTTTSYALLGLLGLRSWTTYELAQQMERSLRNFWPRAQSKLYEEPKNLVAHGLAESKRQQVGRRPRTVYSISAKGRDALRAWLDEPGMPWSLESEALLKVFFADQGSKAQLMAQVRHIRDWASMERERGLTFVRDYADLGGPFPERLHVIALMVGFLTRMNEAVLDWSAWAEEEVNNWRDTGGPGDREIFRRLLERSESNVGRD